ncbi:hypothetical protein LOD99_13350 [Oopsacas minuta]|uniref:Transposase n=1 Tax=Oopsacas minuta TaxID=111878 RepID=A0AAV7KJD4_9METZ|nr:hypothetical protein LOD99_13350 [Oopsacas minuta]
MVKEATSATRSRAVGMTQIRVSQSLGVNIRTIRRWLSRNKSGRSLENKPGRGCKSTITKIAKIVIAKSICKRHQSTRRLAKRLHSKGCPVSHVTVHTYLRSTLSVKPFKPQKQPKITEKQRMARLQFCKDRKSWKKEEWRRVLFSDESPFELYPHLNHQNDRVWAYKQSQVLPTETVKFPSKILVWGMMSYRAVSELHIIPKGQTVNADYYVREILNKSLMSTMQRQPEEASILRRKMLPDMSRAIFQQDGAPAHTAKKTQEWCDNNLVEFWTKETWPGNSPDLNPIENLWSIVKHDIQMMPTPTNVLMLENHVKLAWSRISPEILENLVSGMCNRVKLCIKRKGGYIRK